MRDEDFWNMLTAVFANTEVNITLYPGTMQNSLAEEETPRESDSSTHLTAIIHSSNDTDQAEPETRSKRDPQKFGSVPPKAQMAYKAGLQDDYNIKVFQDIRVRLSLEVNPAVNLSQFVFCEKDSFLTRNKLLISIEDIHQNPLTVLIKSLKMENVLNTPDSHLQNPIRIENRRLLLKSCLPVGKKYVPNDVNEIQGSSPTSIFSCNLLDSERLYGIIFQDIYSETYPISPWVRDRLPPIWRNIQQHVSSHNPFPDCPITQKDIPLKVEIIRYCSVKQNWELIRIAMQRMRLSQSTKWVTSPVIPSPSISTVSVSQLFVLITDKLTQEVWLMDYDQMMMICDTISARIFSLIYCELAHVNAPGRVCSEQLKRIYQVWDSAFNNYGNDAFSLIKTWEPFIQGIW